jgi:hypothetical protein
LIRALWGVSADGTPITLLHVTETSDHLPAGYETQEYVALYLVLGQHFSSSRSIKAHALEVQCSHFSRWIDHSFFEIDDGPTGEGALSKLAWLQYGDSKFDSDGQECSTMFLRDCRSGRPQEDNHGQGE